MPDDYTASMPDDFTISMPENTGALSEIPDSTYSISPMGLPDWVIIDTLMNHSHDMIYFKDLDSKFILNNKAHADRFGVNDPRELFGKSDADFYPTAFAAELRVQELEIMTTGVPVVGYMEQAMNAAGTLRSLSSSKYPLYNNEGTLIGTWGFSRDMTKLVLAEQELAKANAMLRELTLTDELTGLYNRRHFYNTLKSTIMMYSRRIVSGKPSNFCLLFFDVDLFKNVNDTYGHVVGDSALRYIAGLVLAHTRASDSAFRYGGDEYALILPDLDIDKGREMAERLCKILEENPLLMNDKSIPMTISVGVVAFDEIIDPSDMVKLVDAKLYQAKHEGRNRVI